ncbi:translation initiation factor IF-2-like [Onychomys torridus]|uniref:translation initiation factor IF-2-like n=1 Tax=Onychomys torridus TaxID=38674 RepID=UPI00167F308F|nr:translation initiation factor IF-2-like [Onychomys torridus]
MCSLQILQVGPRPSSPQPPPGPGPTSGTSDPPSLAPPSSSTFPQSRNFCGCRGLRPRGAQQLAASARRGTAVALGSARRPVPGSGSAGRALAPAAPLQPDSGRSADTHLRRTPSSSSGSSGARRALEAASGRAPVCARPGPHPGAAAPARSRPGRGTRLGRSALPGRAGLASYGRAGRGRRRGLAGSSQHGPGEDECFMGSCGLTRGIRPVSPPARAGRGRGGAWRRAGRSPGRAARARTGGYRVQDQPAGGGRGDEGAWRAVQVAGGAQPPGARATRGPRQRRRIPEEAAAPAGDRRHRVPERAVGAGSRAWRPSLAESRRECWASERRSRPLRGPLPACPLNPFA